MSELSGQEHEANNSENNTIEMVCQGVDVQISGFPELLGKETRAFYEEEYSSDRNAILKCLKLGKLEERGYFARMDMNQGVTDLIKWQRFWQEFIEEYVSDEETLHAGVKDGKLRFYNLGLLEVTAGKGQTGLNIVVGNTVDDITQLDQAKHEFETFIELVMNIEDYLCKKFSLDKRSKLKFDISEAEEAQQLEFHQILKGIHGMHSVREAVAEIIVSHEQSEFMRELGAEPIGAVLVKGEPGVGKTMLAYAIAERLTNSSNIITIKATDVWEGTVGESAKNLRVLLDDAKSISDKVVIIFDEFDGITNGAGNEGAQNSVNVELKNQLQDIRDNYPNILVIATTNSEDKVDSAVSRPGRFDKEIYVEMPNEEERLEMILAEIQLLADQGYTVTSGVDIHPDDVFEAKTNKHELNPQHLAAKTERFSGAAIKEVFKRIRTKTAMQALRKREEEPNLEVTYSDIATVIEQFHT